MARASLMLAWALNNKHELPVMDVGAVPGELAPSNTPGTTVLRAHVPNHSLMCAAKVFSCYSLMFTPVDSTATLCGIAIWKDEPPKPCGGVRGELRFDDDWDPEVAHEPCH